MKKLLSFFLAALMVLSLFPLSALAGSSKEVSHLWTVPEGYNEHDYNACVSFLEQCDASGMKNGEKLSENYDANDPESWGFFYGRTDEDDEWIYSPRFVWNEDGRIELLYLLYSDLAGTLNLAGCSELKKVFCECNDINEIVLSDNDMLYKLYCNQNELTELDISGAPNLEVLNCNHNNLSELQLYNCSNLVDLSCCWNQIQSLVVTGAVRLKHVECYYNNISELELTDALTLEWLCCYDNEISSIDLSGYPNLTKLQCGYNELTDLDLSYVPNLELLECAGNRIHELALDCMPDLSYLYCGQNPLNSLDLSSVQNIKVVGCEWSGLYDLCLSNLPNIEELYCYGNNLSELDVSSNHNLKCLYCDDNELTELDLSEVSKIESLRCDYNMISSLLLSDISSLEEFQCSHNQIDALNLTDATELWLLSCSHNLISNLSLPNTQALRYLSCDHNSIANIDLSAFLYLEELSCQGNKLVEIDLSSNTNFPSVIIRAEENGTIGFCNAGWEDYGAYANPNRGYAFEGWYNENSELLSNNQVLSITDIVSGSVLTAHFIESKYNENDFSKLSEFLNRADSDGVIIGTKINENFEADDPTTWTGVKWISVNGEQRVQSIEWSYPDTEVVSGGVLDLSDCSMLESLECSNLHISRLIVNNDASLKQLGCDSNYLTTLDVSTCTSLEDLWCQKNNLTTLNVTNCVNLNTLYFGSEYDETNKVAAIDLSTNVNLERLDCASNKLKTLDVSNCPELVYLSCGSNELTELDVSANTKLASLSCGDSWLTAIDVSNNPLLEDLEVWGPKIAELDLSGNPLLQRLVVRQTGIKTLDLSNNTNLEYCDIYSDLMLKTIVLSDKTLRAEGIGYLGLRLSDYDSDYAHGITIGGSRFYGWYDGNGSLLAEQSGDEYSWESIDLSEIETDTIVARFTQGFNSNDVGKLRAFLELTDEDGVKNGDRLNPSPEYADYSSTYDPNDPLTWGCGDEYGSSYIFNWKDVDGELRLSYVHLGSDWGSSPQLAGPLDLSDCTALQYLYVYNAGIGALNINGCSALEGLACPGNNLTELVLAGCPALTYVTCSENDIAELDLSQCPALTNLECGDNKLVSLDVSSNIELTELNCSKNKLTSLDVSNNNALTRLYCSLNKLLELDVSANTQLEMLYCDGNKLSEIDLSHNPSLEYFDFEYNKFTEIDFSNNPEIPLERLSAEGRGTIGCSNAWGGVNLFAYAGKNGFFSGWYDSDGNLISTENPYDVDGDSYDILTAHFDEHDYNEADLAAVLAFLEQENPEGNKVGTLLSERQQSYGYACFDYESDDPSTWFGVTWCVLDDELRVAGISWSNVGSWSSAGWYATDFIAPVSTTLDLSDFTALSSLECTGLNLTSIGLSGCESLNYVNCRFNKLKSFDLSSSQNITIDSVSAYGNGTVGCSVRSYYSYLYAYPEEGETFVGWYNDANELLSSNSSFYVSNSEDVVFKAVFSGYVPLPNGVTVSCNEGGEIEYTYEEEEDSLTVTWEAEEGYTCTAIKVNGVVIATNPTSPYVIENLSQYAARDGEEIVVEVVFGLSIIPGDVNGDGVVTATDISVLFAYVMNAGALSENAMLSADVNGDGEVNATDASLLAQMVFGA